MFKTKTHTEPVDQLIHTEVYSAQELLLKEAEAVLADKKYSEEDMERLAKLSNMGFWNSSNVEEFDDFKKEYNKAQRIKYYTETYPLYKFIDEDAVERVCSKYGLLLASANDYIDEIPLKNQEEIVGFKIKRKDHRFWDLNMQLGGLNGDNATVEEVKLRCIDYFGTDDVEEIENGFTNGWLFKIIAPKNKLRTENRTVVGHELVVDDPIVLQPVRYGNLIVTSWGFEASDPEIINPKNN